MAIEEGTKFLGISPGVDTRERRSKQINDKHEYYTIEDIAAAAVEGIAPPNADDIVSQFDAENFQTIEAGLEGKIPYEQTIIRIDNFSTSDSPSPNPVWYTAYTNKDGGVPPQGTPLVGYDDVFFTWVINTNASFTANHRYACNVYQYGGGQTNPPSLVTAEFDSSNPGRILIVVYGQSFQFVFGQTTENHLQFGLEINIYDFS
jgi:hypothetical protein